MKKPVVQETIDLLFQYFGQKAVLTPWRTRLAVRNIGIPVHFFPLSLVFSLTLHVNRCKVWQKAENKINTIQVWVIQHIYLQNKVQNSESNPLYLVYTLYLGSTDWAIHEVCNRLRIFHHTVRSAWITTSKSIPNVFRLSQNRKSIRNKSTLRCEILQSLPSLGRPYNVSCFSLDQTQRCLRQ